MARTGITFRMWSCMVKITKRFGVFYARLRFPGGNRINMIGWGERDGTLHYWTF